MGTSSPAAGATFITGTTGFIGGELLKQVLQREPGRPIYSLVRAADDTGAARRGREVLFKLFGHDRDATADAKARVRWVRGDLTAPGLGLATATADEVAAECTELVHAAAATDWDLTLEEALASNFAGAQAMGELALRIARTGRLSRYCHMSTAYVVGRQDGYISPDDLPGPRGPFNNTYEEAKAKAERWLRERMGEAPITVVRPSIVVGDSGTGRTFNFNVLYFPIKLLHRGLLPYCPGSRDTTLDIVPVDYVCAATLALARDPAGAGRTFHLTADDDAIPILRFGERVVDFYNRERARDGRPLLAYTRVIGPFRWRILRFYLRRRLAGHARQQFESFNIYLPYITSKKRFDARTTRAVLGTRVPYPPIESYIERVADYAVTREWGKHVSWDTSAFEASKG